MIEFNGGVVDGKGEWVAFALQVMFVDLNMVVGGDDALGAVVVGLKGVGFEVEGIGWGDFAVDGFTCELGEFF